ncbi:MAG: hypothetical protein FWG68_03885, partial [Defluviitaleaceae bacterium]|nr:hypothetical protein [Defluviitaleaceae bacterium]
MSQEQQKLLDELIQKSKLRMLDEKNNSNREIKDGIFKILFSILENAADLYSSLHNEPCRPDEIQIFTIETVISGKRKNDIALVTKNKIIALFEHMSSPYANLPFRFLIYLGLLYEKWVKFNQDEKKLYSSKLYKIPKPEFVVLYNGKTRRPEQETIRLSDAFIETGETLGNLELEVKVYNINKGMNEELMSKCRVLREYSEFVAELRKFEKIHKNYDTAVEETVKYCISNNILEKFLREHGGTVMSILVYDEKLAMEAAIEDARDAWEEGREEGWVNAATKFAIKLLKKNRPIDEIMEY